MATSVSAFDLDRAVHDAEQIFTAAGRAKVRAEAEDRRRKRVRSALVVKFRDAGDTLGMAEHRAEADEEYLRVCEEWEEAAYAAVTLDAQADAKRMKFEAYRSANALERAKMGLR